MSEAEKQSTKSLKSKTTRRAAKRAKPKSREIELLTEQRDLHLSMDALEKQMDECLSE